MDDTSKRLFQALEILARRDTPTTNEEFNKAFSVGMIDTLYNSNYVADIKIKEGKNFRDGTVITHDGLTRLNELRQVEMNETLFTMQKDQVQLKVGLFVFTALLAVGTIYVLSNIKSNPCKCFMRRVSYD